MQKISALLITYNEEKHIERFLEDADYADEIIIVDSFSEDRTVEIAKLNPKVKLFLKEFDNFSDQRNFALSKASHEWVTFFDADEHITENLKKELISITNLKNPLDAYFVYRKSFFRNKPIKFSGFQSDKVIRLFKKSNCLYRSDYLVHEVLNINGQIGKLNNKLEHYTFYSIENYQHKLASYSKLRAKELALKKIKPNAYHFIVKPLYRFVNHYIIRFGFLDGREGYIISRLHAESVYKRYVFLKQIYEEQSSENN